MATTRQFQDMLNEYLPNKLLREEMIKRDYILQKCQKDDGWLGGDIVVPFRGSRATSVKFGGLTDSTDIAQAKRVRGSITDYTEAWHSLIFDHTDLMQHDQLSEQNLLKMLPDEIEDAMTYFKDVVSVQLGSGPHFATVTDATNAATGIMVVDHIERFELDQKVTLDDNDSAAASYYVTAVNVNSDAVTLSATRGGAAANVSAYSVAQEAKFYIDGVFDAGGNHDTFFSMRSALLSAANGGSTNIHGIAKTAYPYLQAVNIDGSGINATNFLDQLFDGYTEVRKKCKGMADTFLMAYKHLGTAMKLIQVEKGSFVVTSQPKASQYGWTEITIASVTTGVQLKLVGIQEMDEDIIPIVDWNSITFRTNGGFKKRKSPDGKEYFEIRATTGYAYVVDVCLFGEMEYSKPGHNAIIYDIPNY
jgi:hypothetical protein